MKKFINPIPLGGMPFNFEDLSRLQDESSIEILNGLNQPCVVSGCNDIDSDQEAGRVFLSSGQVFLNGEIMSVPETPPAIYGVIAPVYIVEDTPEYTQRTFEDGVTKNALIERKAKYQTTVPASGDYIICNVIPIRFKDLVVSELKAIVDTKADKVTTINWQYPTLQNGATNIASGEPIRYYKDEFKQVHIQASLDVNAVPFIGTLFTLPAGYRPSRGLLIPVTEGDSGGGFHAALLTINTDGNVYVLTGTDGNKNINLGEIVFTAV